MTKRQIELAQVIRQRVPADTLKLIEEYLDETLKEHIESMLFEDESGESLIRRQGRAQGVQEAMRSLETIHKDPRGSGGRNV